MREKKHAAELLKGAALKPTTDAGIGARATFVQGKAMSSRSTAPKRRFNFPIPREKAGSDQDQSRNRSRRKVEAAPTQLKFDQDTLIAKMKEMLVEHDKARDAKVKDIVEQTVHATVGAIMRQGSAHMQMLEQYMSQIAHSAVQTAIGQAQMDQEQYAEEDHEQHEALGGYEDVYSLQQEEEQRLVDSQIHNSQLAQAAQIAMETLETIRQAGPRGGAAAAEPKGGANAAGLAQAATEQEGHKGKAAAH